MSAGGVRTTRVARVCLSALPLEGSVSAGFARFAKWSSRRVLPTLLVLERDAI